MRTWSLAALNTHKLRSSYYIYIYFIKKNKERKREVYILSGTQSARCGICFCNIKIYIINDVNQYFKSTSLHDLAHLRIFLGILRNINLMNTIKFNHS